MISQNFDEEGFNCKLYCDFCKDQDKVKKDLTGFSIGTKHNSKLSFSHVGDDNEELYGGGRKGMKSAMADYMDDKIQRVGQVVLGFILELAKVFHYFLYFFLIFRII